MPAVGRNSLHVFCVGMFLSYAAATLFRSRLDEAGLAKLHAVSPIGAVHKGMPPFLCIHGTKDDQVSYEQSTAMCEAMKRVGVTCDLITINDGGHGMSSWRAPEMQHWKAEMIAWLDKTVK